MGEQSTIDTKVESFGFNQVYRLGVDDKYQGDADRVMLVWHESQILPAEQYRKAHFDGMRTDIAVCQDPKVQRDQLDQEKVLIYHWDSRSTGGGDSRKTKNK